MNELLLYDLLEQARTLPRVNRMEMCQFIEYGNTFNITFKLIEHVPQPHRHNGMGLRVELHLRFSLFIEISFYHDKLTYSIR